MKKLPRDDRGAANTSSNIALDRSELADHLDGRHRLVLSTMRRDGDRR